MAGSVMVPFILAVFAAVVVWVVSLYVEPFTACPRCPTCKNLGRRQKLGSRAGGVEAGSPDGPVVAPRMGTAGQKGRRRMIVLIAVGVMVLAAVVFVLLAWWHNRPVKDHARPRDPPASGGSRPR
jgi:hypothetical protein